jgi:hypothetical protein
MSIDGWQFTRHGLACLGERFLAFSNMAWLSCLSALLLCSCTTTAPDGSVRKYYFGYTVVTFPHLAGNCKAMDAKEVANIGLSLGFPAGIAIGYNKDKAISLSPDGRVVIEVQTDEQFEAAENLIQQLDSIGICVIKSTEPSKSQNSKL